MRNNLQFKLCSLFFYMFFSTAVFAQLTTLWVARDQANPATPDFLNMSTIGAESAKGICVDAAGNSYTAGSYRRNPTGYNKDATFLYKFNSGGQLPPLWKLAIWSERNLSGAKIDIRPAESPIAIGNNAIYLAVNLSVPANIYNEHDTAFPNSSVDIRISNQVGANFTGTSLNGIEENETKAMIFKFDLNGNYLEHVTIEASNTRPQTTMTISEITLDKDGNVYVIGTYNGRLRLPGNLWIGSNACGATYSQDAISLKYNGVDLAYMAAGAWHAEGAAHYNTNGIGIDTDGDNVYCIGNILGMPNGNIDLTVYGPYNWSTGTPAQSCGTEHVSNFGADGGYGAFMSKFDLTGGHTWTKIAKSPTGSSVYAKDIVAKDDSCFVLLQTYNNIRYHIYEGGGTTFNNSTFSSATYSIYNGILIAKIFEGNTDDKFRVSWLQYLTVDRFSYPNVNNSNSLYIDADNFLYVLGTTYSSFQGTNTISGMSSPITVNSSSVFPYQLDAGNASQYHDDILLVKYYTRGFSRGYINWGVCIGGPGNENAFGVAVDNRDNTFLAGEFSGQSDFDPSPVNYQLFSIQGRDAFVAKYGCWGATISGSASGCVGDFTTLTASPECPSCVYNYQWEEVNTGNTTTGSQYLYTGNLGTNRIRLTATETGSGCVTRDSIDITFNNAISVSANPTVATTCKDDPASFTASITPNVAGATYNWYDFQTGNLVASGATFNTTTPGGYTVVGNANGCESSYNVNLVNYPVVSPIMSPQNPTICGAGGTVMQVLDCPGCGFVWTVPPISTAASSSNLIVADLPGTYQVNILDQYGCTQALYANVTTAPYLTPPIYATDADGSNTSTICNGAPLTISSTSYSACPTCTYQWNNGSTGPYTFAFTPGAYNVTVTDLSTGCIGTSSTLQVEASSLASPTITADPEAICAPNPALLEVANPCVGCTYTWIDNISGFVQGNGQNLTVAGLGGSSSSGCNSNYIVSSIAYAPVPAGFASPGGVICDDCMSPIHSIGFDFDFYCNTYNQFKLSSNGFLTFDVASFANGCCSGQSLPNAGAPNNIIALAWEDLNPSMGGVVDYFTSGVAPNRRLIVNYNNVRFYGSPLTTQTATVQLILYEGTNVFELHIANITPPSTFDLITQGSENDIGSVAHTIAGRNSQNFTISTPEAWRFEPESNTLAATYFDYYVEVIDTLGCSNTSTVFSISSDSASRPVITTTANLLCGTNTATMSTINCTGCQYKWYRNDSLVSGATNYNYTTSDTGTYKVEVAYDNTCRAFSSNVVSLTPETFVPQIGPNTTVYICNGAPVTIGMEGAFRAPPYWSYQWYRNSVAILGSTGYNHDASLPGVYYVEVTNSNGCMVASNFITVSSSSAGANPAITTADPYLCAANTDVVTLSVTNCATCIYDWRNANNVSQLGGNTNIFETSVAQGYFVQVTESVSGCVYNSPVFQVKDTIYPTPIITALSSVFCSPTPVVLSTPPCVGCEYEWLYNNVPLDTTTVNTFSATPATLSGNYSVIIHRDGCPSPQSLDIPISFVTINAALNANPPSALSICNGSSIQLSAAPSAAGCVGCSYQWIRNNVILPQTSDAITILQGGDYKVVITQPDGCKDTSLTRSYFDVSLATDLNFSATRICGPTGTVTLSVDSCATCNYRWYYDGDISVINYTLLGGQTDTFYVVNGYAARGLYKVEVSINGCVVKDSIFLDTIQSLNAYISPTPAHATICNGVPVQLTAMESLNRPLVYQWIYNGTNISGAITQTWLATTGGNYDVQVIDTFGCIDNSGNINVQAIDPPVGFGLVLDPVGTIPLSYGDFNLDLYLNPPSLHTFNTNYSSLPQPAAVTGDIFSPMNGGPGRHLVTFEYNSGACTFATSDTINILSQMSLDVANTRVLPAPGVPPFEACITDPLLFSLTNFTFLPNQILFPTSPTTYDTISITPTGVTVPAVGVYNGSINIAVPNGAVTGKVILRNSSTSEQFQALFFLLIHNPAVAISLNGVPQPLCSNADTIALSGFPEFGVFAAAYASSSSVPVPSLISGSNLVLDNVVGYDSLTGYQSLKLTYTYTPQYTNGAGSCPNVIDSLTVQVNNVELDSIEYTPISQTQANVSMSTLTRLIWPLNNRNYPGNYVGTYVTGNNLQANTLPFMPPTAPPNSVSDPVIYTFSNGICSNSLSKDVEVWRRPITLDSMPQWICQNADTVFIGRNATSMYVEINGNTYLLDSNYIYDYNSITNGVDFAYDEFVNTMTLTSSNGGLVGINFTTGAERYAFIPSQVAGANTVLNLTFGYERYTSYFTPTVSNPTTLYTIANVAKTINIETPIAAYISPAILADPIFCQDNATQQFSGIPNGGQYYINSNLLAGNLFNPNAVVAAGWGGGADTLTYVFQGNACADTASTTILIPAQFTVTITAPNGPDYCQLDPPDTISVASSNLGIINQSAGVFLVNTVISGQVFNPAVAPAVLGGNNVIYIASDTFGCTSTDTAIFTVNPMPFLRMDTFNISYCLNAPPFVIDLYEDTIHAAGTWHLQTHGYANAAYPNIQVNLTGNGVTPPGLNPAAPYYNPSVAGVGYDTIRYTYTNTITGCATTLTRTTYIKPLPVLTMTTTGGVPLNASYCERDTVPVYATPAGGTFFSLSTTNPGGSNFNTSLFPPLFGANIPGFTPATAIEEIAYRYTDPTTLCTDTIISTILINNFTTDVTITALPNQVCADDTIYVLGINEQGVGGVTGTFGAFWPIDTNMISNPATNVGNFNPYLSGIYDSGRDVVVIYEYVSNTCPNTVYDTVTLKPLPQLHFLMPGDTLFNSSDPTFHECFSGPTTPMYAFNSFNGVVSVLAQNQGVYTTSSGIGMVYNTAGTGNWDYVPPQAQPGLDSIHFTWTSAITGCTNTHSEPMVIDTVPELGFAGFDPFKYDSVTQRFVYCENDPAHLVIPSPFGGNTYWNFQEIPSILFELRPDTLVVGGVTTIHRLTYEYISARYQNGGVCLDSTIQFVEVRPIPILTLAATVPDEYCVSNELERLVLSATPPGGTFQDITLGVIAGILADTLFDPSAQLGTRTIVYIYTDTVSQCSNILYHEIDVFNMPDVSFQTGGGCEGDTVFFMPDPTNLSNSFPALDSISMVIWNYGDGAIDTITNLTNQIVAPNQTHIYNSAGVYFPTLTLINRGQCDTSFTRRIVISPKYNVTMPSPYAEDFQASSGNWFQENGDASINLPTDSLWEWSEALGGRIQPNLTTDGSTNYSWITNPMGAYEQGDNGWVYSPCFDISTLTKPMVKLDIWRDTRDGVDGVVMQYFQEATQTWKTLGQRYKGINWYNPQYVVSNPGNQIGAPIGWSGVSADGWEEARYRLDVSGGDLRGTDNLRFRLAFSASPNSVVGGREGFAFDNFWIGNRTRSVLVEHFTNQSFPNINTIETNLYSTIYSNLYGRDVSLIQYHTDYNAYDYLHQESVAASNSRVLYYGIHNSSQVRVNGQSLASTTDSLINYAKEILDMQMLEDAKFRIKLNPVTISNGTISVSAAAIALEDISYDDYMFHIVVTEDTIQSTQNHTMLSIARMMIPDPSGTILPNMWVAGDSIPVAGSWQFGSSTFNYNPNKLKVVVFVQNQNTKEVYQVATSRNLNIFNGPISVDEIASEDGMEIIDLSLFPNPARNQFTVEFTNELQSEYEWRVIDVLGRTLKRGVAQPGTKAFTVETDNFSPGMYIFSINNETVYTQRKVIIAK